MPAVDLVSVIIDELWYRGNEYVVGLLDQDPSLADAMSGKEGQRPLHPACTEGYLSTVKVLLERGAGIDNRDKYGMTPLMRAAWGGMAEVVSFLLEQGADPALRDDEEKTALMHAVTGTRVSESRSDHMQVLHRLLKDGRVPVDARSKDGKTAFYLAFVTSRYAMARVLLVEGRADPTIAAARVETLMDLALRRKAMGALYEEDIKVTFGRDVGCEEGLELLQWYEGELEKPFLLSKARAVMEGSERIVKAAEKAQEMQEACGGAETAEEMHKAREGAAPRYLKGRVARGEALPELVVGQLMEGGAADDDDEEEQRREVWEHLVAELKEDLFVELVQGLAGLVPLLVEKEEKKAKKKKSKQQQEKAKEG